MRQTSPSSPPPLSTEHNGRSVGLFVDHPLRDLPGLVLTAWRACQQGVACYLIPANLATSELWRLDPRFVLANYLRLNNQRFVKHMLDSGLGLGVLDSEGSVFSYFDEYSFTLADDKRVRDHIACYCAWTPAFAQYASHNGWYRADQIVVTGPPRADFYSDPWRQVACDIARQLFGDYPEPLILVNGSFPLVNPCFQSREQEAELMVRFSYDRGFVEKWQNIQCEAMEGMVRMVNHLARTFPNVTFIYRPHPFEGDEYYKNELARTSNLHLVKKGTVDSWLVRAKALIHWGSSTALDANLLGLPALTPGWLPVHLPVPVLDAVTHRIENLEEMVQEIARVSGAPRQGQAAHPKIERERSETVFFKCDGQAHERVANAVVRALDEMPRRTAGQRSRFWLNSFRWFCRNTAKTWVRRHHKVTPRSWAKSEKFFDAQLVSTYLARIEDVASNRLGSEPIRVQARQNGFSIVVAPARA